MKGILALSAAAMAASSWSVFDLQKVSRFNSSALVDSSLNFVVSKTVNGYIAAGKANDDIYLVEYDAFGSILRTALWDSPLVQNDTLVFLGRYVDGRVLIGTNENGRGTLVQFSPNLTVNWEVQRTLSGARFALDGSGNAYMANGSSVESISGSGASQGVASIANFALSAMAGIPGASNAGVVLVGRHTTMNQPRAIRFTNSTAIGYDRTDTSIVAASGSRYNAVDVESDMDVVIGGQTGSTGSTNAFFTTLNGAGIGQSASTGNGTTAYRVKIRNSTDAYALTDSASGARVLRLVRSTATVAAISAADTLGYNDMTELTGPALLVCPTESDTTRFLNPVTLAPGTNASFGGYEQVIALTSSLALGVRGREGSAEVAYMENASNISVLRSRFVGAPERTFLHSVSLPDGSVAMIARETGAGDVKMSAVRYSASGALIYAKSFGFGDQDIPNAGDGAFCGFPDGGVAFAVRLNLSTWGFVKISNTGVVRSAAFPFFTNNMQPSQLAALPDGSTAVFSQGGDNAQLVYTRVTANAVINQEFLYLGTTGYNNTDIAPTLTLANGDIFIAAKMTDSTVKFHTINPTNGVASPMQTLGANCKSVRAALDGNGDVVIAYDDGGGLKLERRSGANVATVLNSVTGGTIDRVIDAKVGPNGNTVVLCQQTGDDQIKIFGPGGFAGVATSTFPSTIARSRDLDISASNIAYITADEFVGGLVNVYSARYLPTGIRSAQRRTAGTRGGGVHAGATGVWITGEVGTRKKGVGPFAARYSL